MLNGGFQEYKGFTKIDICELFMKDLNFKNRPTRTTH